MFLLRGWLRGSTDGQERECRNAKASGSLTHLSLPNCHQVDALNFLLSPFLGVTRDGMNIAHEAHFLTCHECILRTPKSQTCFLCHIFPGPDSVGVAEGVVVFPGTES